VSLPSRPHTEVHCVGPPARIAVFAGEPDLEAYQGRSSLEGGASRVGHFDHIGAPCGFELLRSDWPRRSRTSGTASPDRVRRRWRGWTRISACNVARDRSSPATAHQINPHTSVVEVTINRFALCRQPFLRTAPEMHARPDRDSAKHGRSLPDWRRLFITAPSDSDNVSWLPL
jgi:hypothetical protein